MGLCGEPVLVHHTSEFALTLSFRERPKQGPGVIRENCHEGGDKVLIEWVGQILEIMRHDSPQRRNEVREDGGRNFGHRRDWSRGEQKAPCSGGAGAQTQRMAVGFLNRGYLRRTGLLEWCFGKRI